jgi:hypothetical protein
VNFVLGAICLNGHASWVALFFLPKKCVSVIQVASNSPLLYETQVFDQQNFKRKKIGISPPLQASLQWILKQKKRKSFSGENHHFLAQSKPTLLTSYTYEYVVCVSTDNI